MPFSSVLTIAAPLPPLSCRRAPFHLRASRPPLVEPSRRSQPGNETSAAQAWIGITLDTTLGSKFGCEAGRKLRVALGIVPRNGPGLALQRVTCPS